MNLNKILFITSEFPPQPGGIGNHAHNLALSLQKEGKQIIVLSDIRSINGKQEREFDVQLPFLVKRIKRRKVIVFSYFDRFIKAMILIKSVDMVLASGKFSLWLVFFLKLFYSKKYIAIIHGSEVNFKKKYLQFFINKSLKQFDEVIAVSNFTKSLVSDLNLKSIHVIPNGVDIKIQKEVDAIQLKGNPSLITVGNVTDRKGQANVIKMLPALIKFFPNIHYHCVGIPTQKEEFSQLATQLNVEDCITFHGKVSECKLHQLLKNSDIFVMLSSNTKTGDVEGFGIAILEANFFGTPAIGSLNCGIEDAIINEKTGFLIDNKDEISFKNAIDRIISIYPFYSENSKKWANDHHWQKIIKEYIKVIEN